MIVLQEKTFLETDHWKNYCIKSVTLPGKRENFLPTVILLAMFQTSRRISWSVWRKGISLQVSLRIYWSPRHTFSAIRNSTILSFLCRYDDSDEEIADCYTSGQSRLKSTPSSPNLLFTRKKPKPVKIKDYSPNSTTLFVDNFPLFNYWISSHKCKLKADVINHTSDIQYDVLRPDEHRNCPKAIWIIGWGWFCILSSKRTQAQGHSQGLKYTMRFRHGHTKIPDLLMDRPQLHHRWQISAVLELQWSCTLTQEIVSTTRRGPCENEKTFALKFQTLRTYNENSKGHLRMAWGPLGSDLCPRPTAVETVWSSALNTG